MEHNSTKNPAKEAACSVSSSHFWVFISPLLWQVRSFQLDISKQLGSFKTFLLVGFYFCTHWFFKVVWGFIRSLILSPSRRRRIQNYASACRLLPLISMTAQPKSRSLCRFGCLQLYSLLTNKKLCFRWIPRFLVYHNPETLKIIKNIWWFAQKFLSTLTQKSASHLQIITVDFTAKKRSSKVYKIMVLETKF